MYKLLLVSNKPDVVAAFEAVSSWEILGFKKPRFAASVEEAAESLKKHHADAVSFLLSDEDNNRFGKFLTDSYPLLPIMSPAATSNDVISNVNELRRLLNQIFADDSDERYSLEENMRRARHSYFRELISGHVHSTDAIRRNLSMLRSRMNPDRACVLIRFALPKDDSYLYGHWHYGPERLEVAMRNIFGAELQGMRLLVSVLENNRIYLLACPMYGAEQSDGSSMTAIVSRHAEETISHVYEYLGIDMRVDEVSVLPSVTALATIL